jgi:hypothetical protein
VQKKLRSANDDYDDDDNEWNEAVYTDKEVTPNKSDISNKTPKQMQPSILKFYYFVVQILLGMFRALLCPSSGWAQ